jgi:Leucine-rich repeat (LRR) protein
MPSRVTVILVSLLLSTPAVIFWLWLLILPVKFELVCPEECRCEADGYFALCLHSGLSSIPSNLPTYAHILVLEGNNLISFENDTFVSRGLVNLEILRADFCELTKIELGAFNGLKNLKYLSMLGNGISEIIPGTFEEINRVLILDLSYNIIEHLKSGVFSGLVNLRAIGLQGNNLQYLHPDTFLGLSKSQGLQIPPDSFQERIISLAMKFALPCYNAPSVSVQTLANVSALQVIDLSYNNLSSIDINILKALPNLFALYLYGNQLQCDCQLQEVWRWCQDHNIQTAYIGEAPECDTPSEVEGIW